MSGKTVMVIEDNEINLKLVTAILYADFPQCSESVRHLDARLMNTLHNEMQPVVDLFTGPRHAHAVLRHFQSGHRNSACVRRFCGAEQNSGIEKVFNTVERCRHIGAFSDDIHFIL